MIKGGGGHKSSWIRPTTRLCIYIRDAFCCVYCGIPGFVAALSIDHVIPRVEGGHNRPDNLVTACKPCNEARRAGREVDASRVDAQRNQPITAHVREAARRLRAERPGLLVEIWTRSSNNAPNHPPVVTDEAIPF